MPKFASMIRTTFSTLVLVGAFLFSLIALIYLLSSFAISELDDVRLCQFVGIPSVTISAYLSILLIGLKRFKFFLVISITNTFSAIGCFFATISGTLDVITFTNKIYFGHQGNNYTSVDLFFVGIIPLAIVTICWVLFSKARKVASF